MVSASPATACRASMWSATALQPPLYVTLPAQRCESSSRESSDSVVCAHRGVGSFGFASSRIGRRVRGAAIAMTRVMLCVRDMMYEVDSVGVEGQIGFEAESCLCC
eukprot:4719809-Prymnesium_polylepis.1